MSALIPYHARHGVYPRHKWQSCINAYSRGELVEWRNNGGNNPPSEWYPMTHEMTECRGVFYTLSKAFGQVWDWPWMDFRLKPDECDADSIIVHTPDGMCMTYRSTPSEVPCRLL